MRLLKSRIHHWSSSKFANWIRGVDKPYALEWGQWSKWQKEQRDKRPFRYWLSDTVLNKLQDILYFPLDIYYTFKIYVRNRYIDKVQYLHTGLEPGQYYDLDHRILYGLFNELVDFVELELSLSMKHDTAKKYKFVRGRCQEAQDDYFRWAVHLKHQGRLTEQAKASRTIKELYEWWKYIRPQRKEPYDDPAFGDIDDMLDNKKFKKKKQLYKKAYDLEKEHDDEDTKMLIQLIMVRNHLWS